MPPRGSEFRPVTPASRLLFWIRAAFIGDAALAAFGGLLLATGSEGAAVACFAFAGVRAVLGVAALLIALKALERRDPRDDRPSAIY